MRHCASELTRGTWHLDRTRVKDSKNLGYFGELRSALAKKSLSNLRSTQNTGSTGRSETVRTVAERSKYRLDAHPSPLLRRDRQDELSIKP